ncbi:hypothetical protein LSAT2_002109 [Lamellibrachia satsuma]|nr:hypothetical protein LSAT2_002109 [Lamellibrachia satsuma]
MPCLQAATGHVSRQRSVRRGTVSDATSWAPGYTSWDTMLSGTPCSVGHRAQWDTMLSGTPCSVGHHADRVSFVKFTLTKADDTKLQSASHRAHHTAHIAKRARALRHNANVQT